MVSAHPPATLWLCHWPASLGHHRVSPWATELWLWPGMWSPLACKDWPSTVQGQEAALQARGIRMKSGAGLQNHSVTMTLRFTLISPSGCFFKWLLCGIEFVSKGKRVLTTVTIDKVEHRNTLTKMYHFLPSMPGPGRAYLLSGKLNSSLAEQGNRGNSSHPQCGMQFMPRKLIGRSDYSLRSRCSTTWALPPASSPAETSCPAAPGIWSVINTESKITK